MQCIQVAYSLRIEGLQFPEISFADTIPEFKNIILRPVDGGNYRYELLIKKHTISTFPQQLRAIFNEASIEAEAFKYTFSLSADVKIFEFECLGYYKSDSLVRYSTLFRTDRCPAISAIVTFNAGENCIKKIKDKMKETIVMPKAQMFYDAATILEPVSRFLALYAVLLHNFDDNQKKVDIAILKIDPTVAQVKRPHADIHETIFSKLRNEISHKRERINMLDSHMEIKLNVDRFEDIVKQLILGIKT